MRIEQLIIYPVKGLRGISVNQAKALEKGFEHDRRYMVVDKDGVFLSQRVITKMALIDCKIEEDQLKLSYQDQSFHVDLKQETGTKHKTKVWNHYIDAIEVNPIAHEWFSDILQHDCKLVKMNKDSKRKKSLIKAPRTTQLSFADGYPYLVLGTASLDYLNQKLESPVPMDRFRANIIVNSEYEHQEDEVDKFTLSGHKFRMIKPCARCQVITIDQSSGAVSKEPLKTLASYRKKSNKIYFGMNAVCIEEGLVTVGEKLIEVQ